MFWPASKWTWAFTIISLVQAALILGFEAYIFAVFQSHIKDTARKGKDAPTTTIPTFLALYIFAFVYQLVLVWDALRLKNTIQVIGLVGLNIGLLIYGAVQTEQLHDAVQNLGANIDTGVWNETKGYLIAIPAILGVFTILMAFVAWKLYDEFAWTIYKHISADLRMKTRYLTYQIYIALLKFDFFFALGFTIQFVVIVGGRNDVERYLTVAAIPVTIIILLGAAWLTRRENLVGTIVVIILYFCGLAYFMFKLVRMYQPAEEQPYIPARKELTTFAVLTILLLLSTIIVACMCANNYKKGLQPYITDRRRSSDDEAKPTIDPNYPVEMVTDPYGNKMGPTSYTPNYGRPAQTRMEID